MFRVSSRFPNTRKQCFLVFGNPDEILAIVFEISHRSLLLYIQVQGRRNIFPNERGLRSDLKFGCGVEETLLLISIYFFGKIEAGRLSPPPPPPVPDVTSQSAESWEILRVTDTDKNISFTIVCESLCFVVVVFPSFVLFCFFVFCFFFCCTPSVSDTRSGNQNLTMSAFSNCNPF